MWALDQNPPWPSSKSNITTTGHPMTNTQFAMPSTTNILTPVQKRNLRTDKTLRKLNMHDGYNTQPLCNPGKPLSLDLSRWIWRSNGGEQSNTLWTNPRLDNNTGRKLPDLTKRTHKQKTRRSKSRKMIHCSPSFHCTITKEQLRNNDCPYIFWANIWIPILEKPVDPVATMFEHLKSFLNNRLKINAHFTVFPHNLSKFKSIDDLPEALDNLDLLPDNVNKWLQYFPGAHPQARGGYTYTSTLLSFYKPLTKVLKEAGPWFRKTKFSVYGSPCYNLKNKSLWDGYYSQWWTWILKSCEVKSHSGLHQYQLGSAGKW